MKFPVALVGLLFSLVSAWAQDTYVPRFHAVQKVGDRYSVVAKSTETQAANKRVDGKETVEIKETTFTMELTAEVEVTAVNDVGVPSAIKAKIVKVASSGGGQAEATFAKGDLLEISGGPGQLPKIKVTGQGADARQQDCAAKMLLSEFNNPLVYLGAFAPEKPVKVGDEWPLNQAALTKILETLSPPGAPKPNFPPGVGRLNRVVEADGRKSLSMTLTIKSDKKSQVMMEMIEEGDFPLQPEVLPPYRKSTQDSRIEMDGRDPANPMTIITINKLSREVWRKPIP